MKALLVSALALGAMGSVALAETPIATPAGPVELAEAQLDRVVAGRFNLAIQISLVNQISVVNQTTLVNFNPIQTCVGIECSLFGPWSVFVAPTGCGGFSAEFGC